MSLKTRILFEKERIKELVSIKDVVERYTGIKIENNKCLCPLHNEKTPSFFVNNEKGVFYCQGCGHGGDQIRFVQAYLGIDFKSAVAQIDRDFALGLSGEKISVKAQIEARERNNKRYLELQEQARKSAEYNELCAQYILTNNLLSILEPLSATWGNLISRKAYLEYELDKVMEGLK